MADLSVHSQELIVAINAAKAAADLIRDAYGSNSQVKTKADRTPVTETDVECEKLIRKSILAAFPNDGFYGEETGHSASSNERLWLVDPIDGTKAFIRQYPFVSTQIALLENHELRLGVSSAPLFDELAFAERGCGAWLNDEPLKVSNIASPDEAALSTGNLKSLAAGDGWVNFGEFVQRADRIRGYGDFYHYHLLAAGKIEAVIESDVNILDVAALAVIVTEAGGKFTDLNGNAPNLDMRSVLAANPELHETLCNRLSGFVP